MQKRSAEGNRSNTHQLKTYFAKRVTDQVRHVLGIWRMLTDENWPDNHILDLLESNKKLIRYAQHFQEESHLQLGQQIAHTLKKIKEDDGTLNSAVVTQLTELIKKLSQLASRKNDVTNNTETAIEPKKPVYLALNDHVLGQKIEQQLEFFGYKAELIHDSSHFKLRARPNDAIAIIMDVNFDNRFHNGIELIEQLIKEAKVPTIFYSEDGADIHTLLRASRAQGRFFHNATIDMSRIVEEVELITHQTPEAPFRVLIVEDSRTQAFHIEQILNNAGIISKAILDPMLILDALEEFKPEIILMDMYMPVCNGMELANVIRQQDQFVSIPIVFLSAEDDIEKQLNAMSNGGDDFLTKPIKSHHLITAVRNKGKRARKLVALVNQDSLTGLLNHTSILRELSHEIKNAQDKGLPLCFAMIDIDHFKSINDTYGHPVGDRVIKNLAMFLKQRLRKTDFIGRYGGEEFAVVLTNTRLRDAITIFDEIRKRFSQLKQSSGNSKKDFNVTFSCGIVALDESNHERMAVECDEILYDAKRGGRNRVSHRQPL